LLESYRRWLTEDHGLSTRTADKNGHNVRSWLDWLGDRAHRKSLSNLSVADIDAYLALRLPGLRRATRGGVCQGLRSFLRYLHTSGLIGQDLSHVVRGPILYKFDEIPRAFTEEQVKSLLEAARGDLRPVGLRDYAALILLAKYGLRGGEVTRLCLDDIDWRGERIRIRHSKSGKESFLPLLAPVGETLLQYLRFGRPRTTDREIFVRSRAPHQPFSSASALGSMIGRRLARLGIDVKGRHGTHAFRFARALSLLRASVPLKTIGDLLGHRTTSSTQAYLRLPTNELRAISLELPKKGVR
jgi:site-specific recombinase XerD